MHEWLFLRYRFKLLAHLRSHDRPLWEELGRPTFWDTTISSHLQLLRLAWTGRETADPRLRRLLRSAKRWDLITAGVFLLSVIFWVSFLILELHPDSPALATHHRGGQVLTVDAEAVLESAECWRGKVQETQ